MTIERLSDIQKIEDARLERAWTFEQLEGDLLRKRSILARLESQVSPSGREALRNIHFLAAQVPPHLHTTGTGQAGLVGGYKVRDLLMLLTANALNQFDAKAAAHAEELTTARTKVAEAEAAMAAFEEEHRAA